MSWIICATLLTITNVLAYHDPDLNYHVNQLQKLQNLQNCDQNGYSYPAPALQLTTSGVQYAAPPRIIPQPILPAPATYSGINYQPQPQLNPYSQTSPPVFYPNIENNNVAAQREEHGYATSAGLSAYSTSGTVRPQSTYAQAPIIAKITAAPLIARFSAGPAKTTYVTQNSVAQSGYSAGSRESLKSYSAVQSGGPVVSQVYAAPSVRYETSAALKQSSQAQLIAQRYLAASQLAPASNVVTQSVVSHAAPVQYSQYGAAGVQQYAAQSAVQYSAPATAQYVNQFAAPAVKYATPSVQQYSSPAIQYTQHAAPVAQYAAQQVAQVAQYATQGAQIAQYATHGAPFAQYSAQKYTPSVAQYAPAVAKVAVPAVQQVAGHIKNAHTEFLENYDAHPKYAYEYGVNDPHTGDIKHQKEERDGEVVKGEYSLVEPDGSVRTVEYVADWETGFHANVRNSKDNQH